MNHYVDTHAHIFAEQYADDFEEMLAEFDPQIREVGE